MPNMNSAPSIKSVRFSPFLPVLFFVLCSFMCILRFFLALRFFPHWSHSSRSPQKPCWLLASFCLVMITEVYISIFVGAAAPTNFFFVMQKYSNQGISWKYIQIKSVLCRNIGQVPLRVTQSCAADYLDRTWMQCLFFFRFH